IRASPGLPPLAAGANRRSWAWMPSKSASPSRFPASLGFHRSTTDRWRHADNATWFLQSSEASRVELDRSFRSDLPNSQIIPFLRTPYLLLQHGRLRLGRSSRSLVRGA